MLAFDPELYIEGEISELDDTATTAKTVKKGSCVVGKLVWAENW